MPSKGNCLVKMCSSSCDRANYVLFFMGKLDVFVIEIAVNTAFILRMTCFIAITHFSLVGIKSVFVCLCSYNSDVCCALTALLRCAFTYNCDQKSCLPYIEKLCSQRLQQ